MRPAVSILLASALAVLAPTLAHGDDAPRADALEDKPLVVTIDRSKVDLVNHKLEVKLSRPASKVKLKVVGDSGAVLAEVEKDFDGAAAGTALEVSWTPSSSEDVAKIEVWGHDTGGFFSGVAITPWKANVPHQEVTFETDSDVIRASETPKLEASLAAITDLATKHGDLGKITLFVVGHTDTVGPADHNLTLSRKRARAIAAWFKAHGFKSPIAYEGVGESVPLVKTDDEVDEPKNRRVDYLLALEPPTLPGSFSWKTP